MRVIIADDQAEVRSALKLLLEERPDVEITGEVNNSYDLLLQTGAQHLDVILLDWELPGYKPDELIPLLQKINPHTAVIALSSRPQVRQTALKAGVRDFVCKSDPPESLLAALDRYLHS